MKNHYLVSAFAQRLLKVAEAADHRAFQLIRFSRNNARNRCRMRHHRNKCDRLMLKLKRRGEVPHEVTNPPNPESFYWCDPQQWTEDGPFSPPSPATTTRHHANGSTLWLFSGQ